MRSRTRIAALMAAAALGLAGWRLSASGPPEAGAEERRDEPQAIVKDQPRALADTDQTRGGTADERDTEQTEHEPQVPASIEKLDPSSDAFAHRLDIGIPNRLYREVADRCYAPGLPKDAMLKLEYRLRVMGGDVRVWELKTLESSIGDPRVEECIRDTVANAGWHDDAMPDWDREDELVVRIGGLKKHLSEDRVEETPNSANEPSSAEEGSDTLGEQG